MRNKPYKAHKRGAGRHVQLSEWLQATEAWATMRPGPRALYIELRRRFNGSNNGDIFLSHRDAAHALNINRNTATGYFRELEERGFILMTQAPHLGPEGMGLASKWALQEELLKGGNAAPKGFVAWRRNSEAPPEKQAPPARKTGQLPRLQGANQANRPEKQDAIGLNR
jgi:DNA-binding transcriptional MocR family regulator